MSELLFVGYHIEYVKPTVVRFKLKDGEVITLNLYLFPSGVAIKGHKMSVVVNGAITVYTNKPKSGELYGIDKMKVLESIILAEVEEIEEGESVIKVNQKEIVVTGKVTNIRVYPQLRDNLGAPCVSVSWMYLMSVK